MKPYFPENWLHSLAESKSRMTWKKEQVSSLLRHIVWWACSSDFQLHFWIWWVAVVFLKSSVRFPQQLENSAFSQSFAFSYGEKLEDTTRAEWPKASGSALSSRQNFLHKNCCVFPGAVIATVFMEQDQGDLGFACLPGCFELCCCAPVRWWCYKKRIFLEWLQCDCLYFFLSGSSTLSVEMEVLNFSWNTFFFPLSHSLYTSWVSQTLPTWRKSTWS